MPGMDIFNNDAFTMTSLTAAINEMPATPKRIATLGYFEERSVATTLVWIEQQQGRLRLVQTSERGAPGQQGQGKPRRDGRAFKVPHIRLENRVIADEVQNVRAFGSETDVETVQTVVNQKLATDKRDIEATIEYHRVGAIKGLILDADGSLLYDLYDEFDIEQQEVDMHLDDDAQDLRTKILEAKDLSEDALGSETSTGFRALCGKNFFRTFIAREDVKDAYRLYNASEMLRNDPRGGFEFGDVIWEEFKGKVDGESFIDDDEAYLVPEGVADLFVTWFAPADYVETANTMGLPFYAKQEPMKMGRGVELESQSNPLNLCTRPGTIIKLHKIQAP